MARRNREGREEGRFTLSGRWTATYRLRAERIGFETVTTPPFDRVAGEEPLAVEILVAVDAVPLAPLIVVSERPVRLNLRLHTGGYHERKRIWGGGAISSMGRSSTPSSASMFLTH